MKLPSIPYLAGAFVDVLKRFPLVMLAAFVGTGTMMALLEADYNNDAREELGKLAISCSLALSSLLCAALVVEKWKLKMPLQVMPHLVALVLVVLYYFSLQSLDFDNENTAVRFFGLNLAAHLGVAFIPYLDKASVEDFWEYNKRLFGNFVVGAFYSGVIFAGLSIAILAVNELFNLSIDERTYGHLFFVIAGVFNTAYFLAHFPSSFDFSTEPTDNQANASVGANTALFKNLTKFILIPIVLIYFLILYAFSLKILVTWELPQGWVGKLVLGFSVAGIFTYLLNYLLVLYDDSQLVKAYRRWFFFVLLPMVALLFVAIGRRISDYGVTEARYIVATSGVWLLLMSLYFIVSKKDNIKFIPISLAFFSLLTVVGPFSAFKASERSQSSRLLAVLERNNMLKDGKVVAAQDSLSQKDAEQLRGGIEYLARNDAFGEFAPMFGLPKDSVPDWMATDSLLAQLGAAKAIASQTQCYVTFKDENQREMDIRGYELAYQVYSSDWNKPNETFTGFTISRSGTGLQYYAKGVARDSFDFQPLLRLLRDRGACAYMEQPDSLAMYRAVGQEMEALFHAATLSYLRTEPLQLKEYSGQVVLRKKN